MVLGRILAFVKATVNPAHALMGKHRNRAQISSSFRGVARKTLNVFLISEMDMVSIGVAYERHVSNRGSNIILFSCRMLAFLYIKDC